MQTASYKIKHRDVMYSTGNMVITLYSDRYKPIKLYKTSTLQKAFYLIHFYCLFKFSLGIYTYIYICFSRQCSGYTDTRTGLKARET